MIFEIFHAPADHGRSVHVSICKSSLGERERLTSFTCTQGDWFDFRQALEKTTFSIRADDFYARLDGAMFR